ncbi:bola-like protein [Decorospora gaudefroyi]|uniref:Bola-like protein n=1 Tax=Decorospora gaudefroyi TaxID=184978 RepID=A0A6A5KD03_9PLEO|nr:bola-like protein [Decorospora gaudefroyi]
MTLVLSRRSPRLAQAHITDALKPTTLHIFNDSHKHAHHQAMQGVTSRETHFRVFITSSAFQGKMQLARHRMVNSLMKDELAKEGGIHALQLTTRTPEEEESRKQKEAVQA